MLHCTLNNFQRNIKKMVQMVYQWNITVIFIVILCSSLFSSPCGQNKCCCDPLLCSEPLLLLMVVTSAIGNIQERNIIRKTWGNYPNHLYENSIGLPGTTTLKEAVEDESFTHGDIIQDNFIDPYAKVCYVINIYLPISKFRRFKNYFLIHKQTA